MARYTCTARARACQSYLARESLHTESCSVLGSAPLDCTAPCACKPDRFAAAVHSACVSAASLGTRGALRRHCASRASHARHCASRALAMLGSRVGAHHATSFRRLLHKPSEQHKGADGYFDCTAPRACQLSSVLGSAPFDRTAPRACESCSVLGSAPITRRRSAACCTNYQSSTKAPTNTYHR